MFKTEPVNSNVTTTPKPDNVPINVVVVVTTRSQQPKQQVLKERESIKAKGVEEWQQKKRLRNSFIEIVKQL